MTEQPGPGSPQPGSEPSPGYGPPGSYPGQPPYPGQGPSYPGGPGQPTYGYPPPPPTYAFAQAGQYPGAPVYPPYAGSTDPNARRRYSGWAIAALVTGLVPLIGIVAAVPLGIVALVKISRTGAKGRWMTIVGIVVSVLWWAGSIALAVWVTSNEAERNDAGVIDKAGTLDFGAIRTGDCLTISGLTKGGNIGAFDIKGIPCADSHNAQAVFVVTFPDTSYPGERAIATKAQTACAPKYQVYRSLPFQSYTLYPTESRWDQSDGHRAICFLTNGGKPMTGSLLK